MMTDFSNQQILVSELPEWQTVQFEKISPKYRMVLLIRYVLLIAIFVSIFFIIFSQKDQPWDSTYQNILLGGLGLLLVLLGISLWSLRYWGYALRENDMLYRSGIFSKSVKIIPFRQVQHVDIKEGALSRIFGLSSIALHTAGVGEGLVVPGIEHATVSYIQEYISQKIVNKSH